MLRSGLGILFVVGVLASTGLALNCYQCRNGFLRSNKTLAGCSPSNADNVTCPTDTQYCLRTDGAYNWSYVAGSNRISGSSSDGKFLDCGTPAMIRFLLGDIRLDADVYCNDNVTMYGQLLDTITDRQWFGLNGTVCLCKGVTCNSGNTFSATAMMLMIPAVLSVMFFMK
ncbi:uncharacterized protein LOC129596835 [Paramacrobiotus metropolitanus]|uniref:uncharacterized protein LOC129596835 n=1 Tax=Paramacrobiotus metropolitanus TaxID=2943436 RepID=UPI002445F1D9|nr:uncharacterized protein LOC129596835 [Paramacrobiotus metropolitanus]